MIRLASGHEIATVETYARSFRDGPLQESDQSDTDQEQRFSDNCKPLNIRGELLDVISITLKWHGRRIGTGRFQ